MGKAGWGGLYTVQALGKLLPSIIPKGPRRLHSSSSSFTMSKTVTKEELKAHNTKQSFYILLHGKGTVSANHAILCSLGSPSSPVYDATNFLDEVSRASSLMASILRLYDNSTQEAMKFSCTRLVHSNHNVSCSIQSSPFTCL